MSTVGGGLVVIGLGLAFVVMARVDPGRYTQPWLARQLGKRIGREHAEEMLQRSSRFNLRFYRLLGWVTVLAGCSVVVVGLVDSLAG
jgi:hypothetical protein